MENWKNYWSNKIIVDSVFVGDLKRQNSTILCKNKKILDLVFWKCVIWKICEMESALADIVGDIEIEIPVPVTPSRLEDCPTSPSAVVECVSKLPDIPVVNHGTTSDEDSGNENTTTINPRTRTTSRSNSPPPNCAICLSKCKDRCFTDSCLHQFCFKCLSEWSKVRDGLRFFV